MKPLIQSQKRNDWKPKVLDLFCGAGGMSLGFQNAGCEILGGIDHNPYAIKTHHINFPTSTFQLPAQDIENIDFSILDIEPNIVDVLIGGPPCQVFSRVGIGKMQSLNRNIKSDPRNFLYKHYIRAIEYFRPLFFVMENVDSLEERAIFSKLRRQLESGIDENSSYPGYIVHHAILTASEYGVPKVRKRLFIVGVRRDIGVGFKFPPPSYERSVTVGDAISDLIPLTPPYIPLRRKSSGPKQLDFPKPYLSDPQSEYQRSMRKQNEESNHELGVMNHLCRAHNPVDMICFAMLGQGQKYIDLPESMRRYRWDIFDDKYKRLNWNEQSIT